MISPAKKYLVVFMDDRLDTTQKYALAAQKVKYVLSASKAAWAAW